MISCSRQTDSPLEMLLKKVRMEKMAELSLTAIVYLTLVLWAMISLLKQKKILTIQMKIAKLKAITVEDVDLLSWSDAMGSFRECYIYNHEH